MKKALVALSLAALFAGSAAAAPTTAPNENGVVNFSGRVVAQTCNVTADTANQTVTLEPVWVSDLNAGKTVKKDFSIKLENCSDFAGKVALVQFNPEAEKVEDGVLKNQADPLSNVGIVVKSGTQNVLTVPASVTGADLLGYVGGVDLTTPQAVEVLNYSAEYAKTNTNSATAGLVRASLPFTVVYK